MNARVSLRACRLKWLALLLALILLAGVAPGAELLRIPEDMPLPLYALGLGHSGESPEDWIVTAFCYPPDSFKANYNLFNQPVDPSLLPDQPCFLEGFALFDGGPVPIQSVLTNVPGVMVPVWFTPVWAWNDKWSVSNMEKQQSLVGRADFIQDMQQPSDPTDPNSRFHHLSVASGILEDGRTFYVYSEVVWFGDDIKDAQYNVTVRFGD